MLNFLSGAVMPPSTVPGAARVVEMCLMLRKEGFRGNCGSHLIPGPHDLNFKCCFAQTEFNLKKGRGHTETLCLWCMDGTNTQQDVLSGGCSHVQLWQNDTKLSTRAPVSIDGQRYTLAMSVMAFSQSHTYNRSGVPVRGLVKAAEHCYTLLFQLLKHLQLFQNKYKYIGNMLCVLHCRHLLECSQVCHKLCTYWFPFFPVDKGRKPWFCCRRATCTADYSCDPRFTDFHFCELF